jgi:hypothetical protein
MNPELLGAESLGPDVIVDDVEVIAEILQLA